MTQWTRTTETEENGFVIICISLSAITQRNKQTMYSFNDRGFRSTYNTILQYLEDSDHNDDNNINYKSYVHRGLYTPYGKMTHKENLDQSQNHF